MAAVNLKVSGIYVIRNTVSERVYVGSAHKVSFRWNRHRTLLRRGQHHSSFLQASWNKHGEAAFVIELLEAIPDTALLRDREQFWIDALGAFVSDGGLNAARSADHPTRGKNHTDARRRQIGDFFRGRMLSPEHVAKSAASRTGLKRSAEFKARMSALAKGRAMSPETRAKIGAAGLGRKMPPEAIARTAASWLGRKHAPESIAKMRTSQTGRRRTPESIAKYQATVAGRPGHPHSLDTIAKLKASALIRPFRARDPATGRYL